MYGNFNIVFNQFHKWAVLWATLIHSALGQTRSLRSTLILRCRRHLSHFHIRVPLSNILYEFISRNLFTKANGTSDADFKVPVFYRHIFHNISTLRTSGHYFILFFYFYFFFIFANKFPVFPTLLTGLQHCTGYKVRRRQKKSECKMLSFSCFIMHTTRQYISRTPSDRSRNDQISALRLVHYILLACVW